MIERIKRPLVGWLGCVAALILLALVAYRVDHLQRLDATVLHRFAAHQGSARGSVASVIVHLADPVPLLAMLLGVCILALRRGRPRRAIAAVVLVAGANLTTQIVQVVLDHPRYQPVLAPHQVGALAFPSGHATAAASIAFALILVVPRIWTRRAALIGACYVSVICISILILKWHYPSDVLGGILMAGGWYFAVVVGLRIADRLLPMRSAQLAS